MSLFFSYIHHTASKSTEIACPHGDCQSVLVVMWEYHAPVYNPPPVLPDANMQKGGGYLQDSMLMYVGSSCELFSSTFLMRWCILMYYDNCADACVQLTSALVVLWSTISVYSLPQILR